MVLLLNVVQVLFPVGESMYVFAEHFEYVCFDDVAALFFILFCTRTEEVVEDARCSVSVAQFWW